MQKVIFAADDIAASRGGRQILRGVTLKIKPGDAVLVRGPNGAGKTTLLRVFAGLLRPDKGAVMIRDAASGRLAPGKSDLVVFCGALNAHKTALTVDENLKFWAALYGAPALRVSEARAAFCLDRYADYPAGALSTGLARRLGLARLAVAARPVWLIDEPTAALDSASISGFIDLVEAHRRAGGLAVIATHDALAVSGPRTLDLTAEAGAA